MLLARMV